MIENQKKEELIKILQNKKPNIEYSAQELINAIEAELLETLWMELGYLGKLNFFYNYTEYRGALFGPDLDSSEKSEPSLEEYFSLNEEFRDWIDFHYDIYYDGILENLDNDFRDFKHESDYVFCLEHGQKLNHLKISSNFNKSKYLEKVFEDGPKEYYEMDIEVTPNKDKIENILKSRGHMFGDLSSDNKKFIVDALLQTLKLPHEGATGVDYPEISDHLLETSMIHPKTPDDIKVLIKLTEK